MPPMQSAAQAAGTTGPTGPGTSASSGVIGTLSNPCGRCPTCGRTAGHCVRHPATAVCPVSIVFDRFLQRMEITLSLSTDYGQSYKF